jgi:hypothetical protein
MHGSAELMVDRFNRGAGACAGPRSTTVREINAEAHHNPPTSMRSLIRFPLLRRVAASFNQSAAANRRPAGQSDGSGNLFATVAADRAFPAAVAELGR